jgi:DNA-binding response OmpR family regulator
MMPAALFASRSDAPPPERLGSVLLVNEDRDLVDLLTFVFERAGFDAIAAYDARTALARVDGADVVVLDADLGPHRGFELLSDLRQRSDVPVVILTGDGRNDDVVRGMDLGANDFVAKPFSHRVLLARVRTQLQLPNR